MLMHEFKFHSATAVEGMQATFDLDTGIWSVHTDMEPYLEEARIEREKLELLKSMGQKPHYRRFAVIPDICVIYIAENYGIDAHHKDFMNDHDKKAKWKKIFTELYPKLVIST